MTNGIDMTKATAKPVVTITTSAAEILAKALELKCCTEFEGRGRRWADTEQAMDLQRRYRLAYRREWIREKRQQKS